MVCCYISLCNLSGKTNNQPISLNFILRPNTIPLLLQYYYKKKLQYETRFIQSPDYYNLRRFIDGRAQIERDSAQCMKIRVSQIIRRIWLKKQNSQNKFLKV
jgi:hypothetical protein